MKNLSKLNSEDNSSLRTYFEEISKLSALGEKFPVSLDDVWPLAYSTKQKATDQLKENFIQDDDFCLLNQKGKQKERRGGHNKQDIRLSVSCLEYFIVRKIRPVFEVYRTVLHQRIAEERNPELIADRYVRTHQKKGKTDMWIKARFESTLTRNQFTASLKKHGVQHEGYRNCTNAIYIPLYGGTTNVVREKKGLSRKESIRDNLPEIELTALKLAELLAIQNIEQGDVRGNAQCELAAMRAGKAVATALSQNKR